MKKLRTILQCNYIYYLLLIVVLIYTFLFINFIKLNSIYSVNDNKITGYIIDKKIKDDKLTLTIKTKEKILVNYYYKKLEEINDLNYGDYIEVQGVLKEPNKNTNFNLFNYKKYLYSKKIFYIMDCKKIIKIKNNNNMLYVIKNKIVNKVNKCKKTKAYINAFVIGNKNDIDYSYMTGYQNLGISHLFAISGMHVSILTSILMKILSSINKNIKYIFIYLFLLLYMFITNFSPSILRASFLFILCGINKQFNLKINTINILLFLASILLLINPLYIYDIAFQFSFLISFFLILFKDIINEKKNYISKLFIISLISFLVSMPIVINNFYQVNILSVLYNLIYVPYISFIVFPVGILTFMFPILDSFYYYLIIFLEYITNLFSNINSTLYFSKIPIFLIIIYYVVIYKLFKNNSKKNKINLIILLIIFYNFNRIVLFPEIVFIDIGQGDSSLIRIYDKNILIDTGGKYNFNNKSNNYNICNNTFLPLFKSFGIKKIDYLVITHGDYDHMGEAIKLVNNFKVEKVIFNCGPYNNLEKDLIKVLDKKKIPYYSCIKELNIDDNKLYFLNNKDYGNENDNSSVIYTELSNHKFLFMGDAGVEVEEDLIKKYNLQDIDVLKVGHHGSKTSSGKEFINEINPKYSIISVGKNNRYGHPNKDVLNVLEDSKMYRTDEAGSIMFKIKNNKLQIEKCAP